MLYARKINKMPEFCMIFARKIFFPIFFWGAGGQLPPPAFPVSYTYGSAENNSGRKWNAARFINEPKKSGGRS